MNYELAKELKDAGFPQIGDVGSWWYLRDKMRWQFNPENTLPPNPAHDTYIPTLEELIEACGDGLSCFNHFPKRETLWQALYVLDDTFVEKIGEGSTPTEAVAKLWLAFNKVK